jgi:very-short-patch-repair endonuclease
MERGYWAKNEQMEDDPDDPASSRQSRVIPYVEDHRNCLLFEAAEALTQVQMASLQAALKHAIQTVYQLEENELAVEPLPDKDKRRIVMLYEAAEGGAGVLRRLVDDPEALSRVARAALDICHFDPNTGEDLRRAPLAREDCEAACYNCLMTYGNQLDHKLLDRQAIKEFLIALSAALVRTSPTAIPRAEHLRRLKATAGSDLERDWLDYLEDSGYSLPAKAQALIEKCSTRPDFLYDDHQAAIYVDGPAHEYPERQQRDVAQAECLEDAGYTVIRFGYRDDWGSIIARHPNIFGRSS